MASGASKNDIVKFIKDEIAETETALGFVVAQLGKGAVQFNRTMMRKKSEYEGVLWALNAVLDIAEGREVEVVEADTAE